MVRFRFFVLIVASFLSLCASPASAQCQLCGPGGNAGQSNGRALRIEIVGDLDFGLAAHSGARGGNIIIDPVTGARTVTGGLVSLPGSSFTGTARITGTPFARVRIDLPSNAKMHAPAGGQADIVDLVADVPSVITLDAAGIREFRFAGRFAITVPDEGEFRGRIQVTATYE